MEINANEFLKHFSVIRDPRRDRSKKHPLETILFIAICAVICGAEGWEQIEAYGKEKEEWLRQYVDLTHGIPSHDTIARVFALMNPKEFGEGFLSWIQTLYQKTQREIIAIDGKSSRRSHNRKNGQNPLHLVSAWASENGISLGQVKTEDKSNEITVIPKLLKTLALKGCIVTIDAMGAQKKITQQIEKQKGDYVVSLKGNHELLHEDIKTYWEDPKLPDSEYQSYQTVEKGHGRIEEREYRISSEIDWLAPKKEWAGFKSIGMVEAKRTVDGSVSIERRYYLTSLQTNVKEFARAVRAHWGIENSCHWVLDFTFREDESRIRVGHAAENFSLLRRIALNTLKKDKASKGSVKAKRLKTGWNNNYLAAVLARI
jgi:predicted transposase YbfD/YdcC